MNLRPITILCIAVALLAVACGDAATTTTQASDGLAGLIDDRELPDVVLDQIAISSSGLIPTPSGYHQISIIEDEFPIASFVVSVPPSFGEFWKVGQDPEPWLVAVLERDPDFGAVIAEDLRNSAPLDGRRLVAIDTAAPSTTLAVIRVQLAALTEVPTPAELIEAYTATATAAGADDVFGEVVPWRGLEAAYVRARVPATVTDLDEPRYEMATYFLDVTNQLQWSVTCDVPVDLFAFYEEACRRVGAGFVPFSMWNDLDLSQGPSE